MARAPRSAGDRIGPYELVRRLGEGGMGDVWEAVLHGPAGFRKAVALKLLPSGRVTDREIEASLLREARLGAMLQHPNVVATLGLSNHDGTWAVALELVRGASTAELVHVAGPLPARALIDVGVHVAAGLAHAHDMGLVHRDLKPANLLVDRTGLVKLADLGISLLSGQPGDLAGTPGYMAPEQADGRAVAASDVFALGATLYALATARKPFGTGQDSFAAIRRVDRLVAADGFLAPAEAAVRGLGAVLARCLAGDAARRPSARELGETIAGLRSAQPEGPTLLSLLGRVRPGVAVDAAGPPSSQAPTRIVPSGNVPPARDRFVGRCDELDALRGLLTSGPARFVVLLGPGGTGKTRLALEIARVLQLAFAGGAWAFDLSEARSEEGVCGAVAAALGVELERRDAVSQLGRILVGKGRALFVLDNLEQCVEHLPRTIGRWIDHARDAVFLATSRVRPGLLGEHAFPLGPLGAADAVALFLERAGRPVPASERVEVDALCAALEGLPLAIELAAARVRTLGVARIRERLSLALLSGGSRERPERHRSLQASLDWSVGLLAAPVVDGLSSLAVFEGGFALESAEAVLAAAGAVDALDVLQELADASLLRVDAGAGRFSMLVVVREYASARASPSARGAAELRHGRHYAQLGTPEALAALTAHGGQERRRALALEVDNVVAACRRAVLRGDGPVAIATLRASWVVLGSDGPLPMAAELALAVAGLRDLSPAERIVAEHVAGNALDHMGRGEAARAHLERALALAQQTGNRRAEAVVLATLGTAELDLGRFEDARARFEASLALQREVGDRHGEGLALGNLANAHWMQGRAEIALALHEQARTIHREVGDAAAEAMVIGNLANLHAQRGRPDLARELHETSLDLYRGLGMARCEGMALANVAILHQEQGRHDLARELLVRALALHRRVGNRRSEGIVLGNLGIVHLELGRTELAGPLFEQALAVHREVGNRRFEGMTLGSLANLEALAGSPERAQSLYEDALALHRELGNRRWEGIVLGNLGNLHLERGHDDLARDCYQRALALFRELGDRRFEGMVLGQVARLVARDGAPAAAGEMLVRGEALLRAAGDPGELARLLAARAEVAILAGDVASARDSLAEADAFVGERPEIRREIARVRNGLS